MPFDKYNVGCYLLDRLAEVGVQDIFGVPGDFNLRFLDDLMTHPSTGSGRPTSSTPLMLPMATPASAVSVRW
eukprot:gene7348-biopygen4940